MKHLDIETRGRPRNSVFTDFCELLAADFPREEMKVAKHGAVFTVYGRLLDGGKQDYLNFRNSVSLTALKKDMKRDGFKVSVYFDNGMVYLKAKSMKTALGVDPDAHRCAFAYLTGDGGLYGLQVRVVRQDDLKGRDAAIALIQQQAFKEAVELWQPDILVVEGQDVRYTGRTSYANPQDVANLSLISGAALALSYAPKKYCPLPREWKGTVPKRIKQCRILDALDIKYEMRGGKDPYPVPVDFEQYCIGKVNASDWQDLTDAVGLAAWGLLQK